MYYKLLILCLFSFCFSQAQDSTYVSKNIDINSYVRGTLVTPKKMEGDTTKIPLIIFVMGQGLTDRNGNQSGAKNDAFKHLARELAKQNVASFRYDKRIFNSRVSELKTLFQDYIKDAIMTIEHFILEPQYSKVIVAGHDQGSLVGMIATQNRADGFISIAGASQAVDKMVTDQLDRQAPGLSSNAKKSFEELRENGKVLEYSEALEMIFRPELQPFMRSWMAYDPQIEIKKIDVPILVIQGDRDLQIDVSEAKKLLKATPFARYAEIKYMNHYLKEVKGSDLENQKSYNEPNRAIMPKVVAEIAAFAKEEKL